MYVVRALTPRVPAEVLAIGVIVPVALVVGNAGHLEGTFFLIVNLVLYSAWHLGSTTRAVAILAVSAATPWLVAHQLAPESEIGWTAWTCACLFTFALGKGLGRQQELIAQLEAARHGSPSKPWPRSADGSPASCTTWPGTRSPLSSST